MQDANDSESTVEHNKNELNNKLKTHKNFKNKENEYKKNIKNNISIPNICLIRIPINLSTFKTQALVDTGAARSMISRDILRQIPFAKIKDRSNEQITPARFRTVAGNLIITQGYYEIEVMINKMKFNHSFYVLKHMDEGCVLGIDFLSSHKIMIDATKGSIIHQDQETFGIETFQKPFNEIPICTTDLDLAVSREPSKFPKLFYPTSNSDINLVHVPPEYRNRIASLLYSNSRIFASSMNELGMATGVRHRIDTGNATPVMLPPRRTPIALKIQVKTRLEEMQAHNIIRESTSPYAAPVVMVPKKSGDLRFCIDYRLLNKVTIKDKYPLPRIDDTIDALYGAKYFSTLDLFSGYWQIEIEEEDKHKTAFVCEFGQYEFNRMPFGLTNAPATFQRLMNKILKPALYNYALVYLDDIIVFSKTIDEHIGHLEDVFKLLANAGLRLKLDKCDFFKNEIEYLGHVVSREGVAPNKQKLKAIFNYPEPKNVKELSSFIGLASYYRKFIRLFAEKAHPLTKLTRKNVVWEWGDAQRDAFNRIKSSLTSQPILRYPDFSRDFIVYTDASGYGIGAVLAQMQRPPQSADSQSDSSDQNNEEEVVIAYTSKHLNDREVKWSVTEKEAYAIIHAVDVFKPYLYGRRFTVITDHRPLEWLMSKTEPSGRLARWALKLQEFDIAIGYRPGKSNQNADCLSRAPLPVIAVIKLEEQNEWVKAQEIDEHCSDILSKLENKNLKEVNFIKDMQTGILLTMDRKIIVPKAKIKEVLEANHDHMLAAHMGVAKTLARIQKQYVWPGMGNDVKEYVRNCLSCAMRKPYGSFKAPLKPMPPASRVWEKIAMDIVGPITETKNSNKYILVLSDYASRFVLTIPMENQKAQTIATHLVKEVITKYGAPETVLTDQGTNFLSKLIQEICNHFKIKQMRTTSYHPQTDGLVERFNRTLCDMLSCYVNKEPETWDMYLPFVTLAYNTSKQTSINNCPFYLFYGREPILPNDIIINRKHDFTDNDEKDVRQQWQKALKFAKEHLLSAQAKQKLNYDKNSKNITFQINETVLLKAHSAPGKFNNRWEGPHKITRKISDLNYEISRLTNNAEIPTATGKQIVHVNRLKKITREAAEKRENVPNKRRGRPPKTPTKKLKTQHSSTRKRHRSPSTESEQTKYHHNPPITHNLRNKSAPAQESLPNFHYNLRNRAKTQRRF